MSDLELTILMPCLNEAETLATCIRKARGYLTRAGIDGEVVIADNGSSDGSQRIAEAEGARVVSIAQKGYGAALAGGIAAARGRYVIMGDADDSYDFEHLEAFVERLRAGDQLVMGNRFRGGIAPGAMPPLHRYFGNPVLSFVGRLFFGTRIGDFHCGLRGFDREAIIGLHLRTTGMEFASEMVVKATLARLRIAEVPTTLKPDGRTRRPHLRSFRDGWRHLRFLLLFSPRWLFLYPGYILLGLGLFLGALVIRGPVQVAPGVVLDIHTLLAAAMFVLVGLQAVAFAAIGRRFAIRYGFVPSSKGFEEGMRAITLERVLLAALVLVGIGLVALIWGISVWVGTGFGDLDVQSTMRVMILAMTALVAGLQLMLSGFLASMIDIPLEEGRIAVPSDDDIMRRLDDFRR
jgi:glycosyltransferase involved in cell wall biosynthesis